MAKEKDLEKGKMKTEYLVEFPDGTVKNAADLTEEEMDMMDYYINAASSRVPGYKVLRPDTEADTEEE